jgi:hypothetical protein
VTNSIEGSIAQSDQKALRVWRRNNKICTFFLDSVDEAKFRRPSDFHHALAKFCDELGVSNLTRARIVISSRITGWNPQVDRAKVAELFGLRPDLSSSSQSPEPQESPQNILVVQLLPLDPVQVKSFVEHLRVSEAERLLSEIERHNIWELVGRPLDVTGIADYWRVHKRIGSLTEIIDESIRTKLKPRTERDNTSPLSEAKAREGAEALGAATVFCRQQNFKVPSESVNTSDALDGGACLPDSWQIQEILELLGRPIFNSASYGCIRFYHRRVSEYLAATWLGQRMIRGCPIAALEQLLFDTHGGKRTLRRSLAPVVAWLCCGQEAWRSDVRNWILKASPEVHLQFGDPSQLPIPYRKAILEAVIDSYAGRKRSWLETSTDALMRLADPQLNPIVSKFILDNTSSNELRIELIRLCRFEQMKECLPALFTIATDTSDNDSVRAYALETLKKSGATDFDEELWRFCQSMQMMSDEQCELSIELLYPRHIDAKNVATLILRTAKVQERSSYLPFHLEQHLERVLTPDISEPLLVVFNDLLTRHPHVMLSNQETRLSSEFLWLLELLPTILVKLLSADHLSMTSCEAVVDAIELIQDARHLRQPSDDQIKKIDGLLQKHTVCRQMIFVRAIEKWTREHPTFSPHVPFLTQVIAPFNQKDTVWIIGQISKARTFQENSNILYVALQLINVGRSKWREMSILKQAVSFDAALLDKFRASQRDKRWGWLRRFLYKVRHPRFEKHKWLMRWYAFRRAWSELIWRSKLLVGYFRLKNGTWIGALERLSYEARYENKPKTPGEWHQCEKKYGRWITNAAKSGCQTFWRKYSPRLPHEKPTSNRIDAHTLLGLAGLEVAYSNGKLSSGSLSQEDVRLATRYACNEIGGFPKWLPVLAESFADDVASVLTQCAEGEWSYTVDRESPHDVLSRIGWEGGALAKLVHTEVLKLLQRRDPRHSSILEYCAQIVARTCSTNDSAILNIVIARMNNPNIGYHAFILWCAVGLLNSSEATVLELEKQLTRTTLAYQIMFDICNLLCNRHDRRLTLTAEASYLTHSTLKTLIPLIYRHIRPSEDIKHLPGIAQSVTARDEVARFRNSLVSSLVATPTVAGIVVLQELSLLPELAHDREWIDHLISEANAVLVDTVIRREQDIRTIQKNYECDPRTDTELFRIVANRLDDVKYSVERSDNSRREEVTNGADEYVLRRFVARQLNDNSRNRFSIAQEPELDLEKRPDIRAVNPLTDPVSLEIKWADNWTLKKLYEGLETQLIGQYLKAHNSRYGMYILGYDGRKKHWEDDSGNKLTFEEVVSLLSERALELTKARNGLEEVRVVSIDFRKGTEE